MRVAFVLFKVFPHGGIARDMGKIAACCQARGHQVRIYTMEWQGPPLVGADIVLLPTRELRSHNRQRRFAMLLARHLAVDPADLTVGMNKMPGLDVYYAGDSCFEAKAHNQRPWFYRLTSRYRHFADFERAVFDEHGGTRILTIAPNQAETFRAVYRTPADRFHELPLGIERDRACAEGNEARALRECLGVAAADFLLLFIGSGFVKKGLGRVLRGIAALPDSVQGRVRLFVIGDDKPGRFRRLAHRLGIAGQVRFVGGRDDVPVWLRAADAFALPAYDEAAGKVILESAIAGVPVLVTANCGYASFIERAGAGIVVPVPFEQSRFNADLRRLLTSEERHCWSRRGRELAQDANLHAMADCAVDFLERVVAGNERSLVAFCAYWRLPTDPRYRALILLAEACRRLGMAVRIYARNWHAPEPTGVEVVRVPVAAMTLAKDFDRYQQWVAEALARASPVCVVSFDREPCRFRGAPQLRPWIAPSAIRCASERQVTERWSCGAFRLFANGVNGTSDDDGDPIQDLPPGLTTGPTAPTATRAALRNGYGFGSDEIVFALVGGDLVAHGFERLLVGLGRLPEDLRDRCRVLAVGELEPSFRTVARALGLAYSVHVVGAGLEARDAIEAADVFVDLAYATSSNGWIFDALAGGRPVVTHAGVAESRLVEEGKAGIVLAFPFRQADLDHVLVGVVSRADERAAWSVNAARLGAEPRHYGQAAQLADLIAARVRRRDGHGPAVPA